MSINSIETATKYSNELDKLFVHKSVTGFFADNSFAKKFVGAKTVIVPDIDFQGLADYDRETGFSKSTVTVSNTPYTMTMDRARSIQIDREDMDETGIAALAGKVLGEYVRTKVVPECDAYVLSKLAKVALSRGNILDYIPNKPYETLVKLINNVRNNVGYDEELVAFVNGNLYGAIQNSAEISKMIMPTSFKQGEVTLTVNSLNGVPLIPVSNNLMKTEIKFREDAQGGFYSGNCRNALIIVCPKKAAHLVKKTETLRVFTPEQNLDADAYKFDYRIYYDAFIKKSELNSIWASVSPVVELYMDITDVNVKSSGRINLIPSTLVESAAGHEITYEWLYSESPDLSSPIKVTEGTYNQSSLLIDNIFESEDFDRYYFLRAWIDGISYYDSDPSHVYWHN